jgi:hypothetical protein
MKNVTEKKIIKFGATWLAQNQNHLPFILEVSVRMVCTQTFKNFDNRESN